MKIVIDTDIEFREFLFTRDNFLSWLEHRTSDELQWTANYGIGILNRNLKKYHVPVEVVDEEDSFGYDSSTIFRFQGNEFSALELIPILSFEKLLKSTDRIFKLNAALGPSIISFWKAIKASEEEFNSYEGPAPSGT